MPVYMVAKQHNETEFSHFSILYYNFILRLTNITRKIDMTKMDGEDKPIKISTE